MDRAIEISYSEQSPTKFWARVFNGGVRFAEGQITAIWEIGCNADFRPQVPCTHLPLSLNLSTDVWDAVLRRSWIRGRYRCDVEDQTSQQTSWKYGTGVNGPGTSTDMLNTDYAECCACRLRNSIQFFTTEYLSLVWEQHREQSIIAENSTAHTTPQDLSHASPDQPWPATPTDVMFYSSP